MTPSARKKFLAALEEHNPDPKTELHYNSVFELLIAVLLSAQSTDAGVNKATARLFPVANTPESLLDLGLEKLKSYINTIGLYNNKAKHVIALCEKLMREYNGVVPHSREALESLPGVGRKTANVILATAFGEPTVAVDTHVFRIANRTGLAPGKTVRAVENHLMKVIPKKYLKNANHILVLHGRYICTARKPHCDQCPARKFCDYGSA